MNDGQAQDAPEGLGGLVDFLSDTPETEPNDEESLDAESAPDEDTAEEATDEQDDEESEDETEEDEEPAPVVKITFKVKGEDGEEETVEATQEELASSYMRQKDYTKKTQALADRENQAVQFLQTKHNEIRTQYTEQAELTRQAIVQMAGLRTESEMAQLAQTDPAAWVAENQRQQSIAQYLGSLDQKIKGERQQAMQEQQQRQAQTIQQMTVKAWEELGKEKIDKPALAKIYEATSKTYGFSSDELGNVYDHRLVKMMRDATAYQALKSKAPEVTRKAQAAPRMPSARAATPAQERQQQAINDRFKGGRAKLNDLAALLR